jgi:hypothetical protein
MEQFLDSVKQFRWVMIGDEQRCQIFLACIHIMALRMMREFVGRA